MGEEYFDEPDDFIPEEESKYHVEGQRPWRAPIEIDKALLTPESSSLTVKVTTPRFRKKSVAVIIRDKAGEPITLSKNGQLLYDVQEHEVFDGFESREISLPGNKMFNIDLTSSFLSERDVPAIRAAQALYADLQLQTLKGKDKTDDMYWLYTRIMSVVNTAKSRDGKTAELSKTQISRGHSEQSVIQRFKEEEKKKSWIPGRR